METAIRLRTTDTPISFSDGLQGFQSQTLESESGDFVIRRRDGLIAYHLAVVVNDALEGISEIVRGIDLMDSTPRQIWLQQLLGLPTPDYLHIPVITHPDGDKLSKLTGAPAIPMDDPGPVLFATLVALLQRPPSELQRAPLSDIWQWGIENWEIAELRGKTTIRTDSEPLAALKIRAW
jgi:glutamyl-Q tRNA(Asp) synthetase